VIELRGGKKVTSKRLLYPGYVMVEMEIERSALARGEDTPRVTGFVGGGNTPVPLTADEVNQILYRQATSADRPRPKLDVREERNRPHQRRSVRELLGKIDEVNPGAATTVSRSGHNFWTATPVELDFSASRKDIGFRDNGKED